MIHFSADEVFRIGMEVELNGKTFYDQAALQSKSNEAKGVLEYLRDQEDSHYALFSTMRDKLPEGAKADTVFDPDGEMSAYLKALGVTFRDALDHVGQEAPGQAVQGVVVAVLGFQNDRKAAGVLVQTDTKAGRYGILQAALGPGDLDQ